MNVYVKDGKILKEKPENCKYVKIPMSNEISLKFFSSALQLYYEGHEVLLSDDLVRDDKFDFAVLCLSVLDSLAESSECSGLFNDFIDRAMGDRING